MNLTILMRYVYGYVDIEVEGYYIERFINICASKGIYLWKTKRNKSTILCARIKREDFKKLRAICKKTQCKMKIRNKKGVSFVLGRYKKRKIFVIFLFIILFVIIGLSNFIWNIEITGSDGINSSEILEIAKENGLDIGKWKNSIDTKKVINDLRLKRDDIAWVGIDIEGTNVVIKIEKADKKPDIIDENEYCSIVADRDATILKISAVNGTSLVKKGDKVKKGDILIAGWMDGKYTGRRYLHAQGEIQAKISYKNKQRIDFIENKKEETGMAESKYCVNINNFKINLYKGVSKFQNYDTIEETKKLKLFSQFYLPISITKKVNKEYRNVQIIHDINEAKEIGKKLATDELEKQIENKDNILDKRVTIYEETSYVEVEVIYDVKESIGTKEKIVF